MSVDVVTFGCRLNAAESEVIRREAEHAGLTDTVVVNTCAVTAEAVRQARQTIRALRRTRPQAKIVVTGCAAQTEPQTFAAMPETDRVLGNSEKLRRRDVATNARRFRCRVVAEDGRQRHHGGPPHRGASGRRLFRPLPRLRPGAERLRSSLHFLHYSFWSRQFALGAHGRGRGRYRAPCGERLQRDRAYRRRPHRLRRRSARRAETRHAGQADLAPRARTQAASPVLHQFNRGRSRSRRRFRAA